MLEQNNRFRVEQIDTWLDAGIPEALLATNKYLLQKHLPEFDTVTQTGVTIIPPVIIGKNHSLKRCIVGPNVSIGNNCSLENVSIKNSIVDSSTNIKNKILEESIIGKNVKIDGNVSRLNLGDNAGVD